MTRPSEIKIPEDSTPGTAYDDFEVGTEVATLEFDITPEIVDEYMVAVEADKSLYELDGRPVAPPNILFVYMTGALYQKYPPIQGIVMAEADFKWHAPIWADETTRIRASGKITDKFDKRGRKYVQWSAEFSNAADGKVVASLDNAFHVPS